MFKKIKIAISIVGGIVGVAVLAIGVLNVAKFAIYKDYYHIEDKVAKLPKVKDGYVHQGTSVFEEENKPYYVTCGYMADKVSCSRIYITDEDNNRKFVELKNQDGSNFLGHTGGITCNKNGITYLASGESVYEIPTNILSLKSDVKEFTLVKEHKFEHSCSAISSIGDKVWIAEFHGHEYVCNHNYEKHHAIAVQYSVNDFEKPLMVLSVPDLVQGIAQNPNNGDIVLSCSYGLADSHYYVYKMSDLLMKPMLLFYQGNMVYNVDDPYKTIKGPAMSEDLEYFDDKIVTAQESGSKKYIFGILFFDKYIHTLDFWNAN